jgi:hypothetical protein
LRHEIVSYHPPEDYKLRYLKMPTPIIIFDEDYEGDTDTIQGQLLSNIFTGGISMSSEMSESACDNIVQRAVTRAQTALGDAPAAQLTGAANAALN